MYGQMDRQIYDISVDDNTKETILNMFIDNYVSVR